MAKAKKAAPKKAAPKKEKVSPPKTKRVWTGERWEIVNL
jgi:DNA-binding protein H-NS